MKNIEYVFLKLKELTLKTIKEKKEFLGASTQDLVENTGLHRTYISHCLNILNKEKKVIKINTRPVYFIELESFEENFKIHLNGEVSYRNFKELMEEKNKYNRRNDFTKEETFKDLIGYDGSLEYQIDQCIAGVKYPPSGLSILITGPTGCGKSFLGSKLYKYAKNEGYIKKDAKLTVFNCAKYSNNKELLSSSIFGHKKGAFTGADEDRSGIIESSNGGFVILDEIHRLPPEGQELLFYFMDTGLFKRIGESDRYRKSEVRFVFATTEKPNSVLLSTFLRRIPIVIKVPALKDRPLNEKIKMICLFFKEEAKSIGCDIKLTKHSLRTFLYADFKGNIGQLKNDIKFSCARAYSNYTMDIEGKKTININFMSLPEYLINDVVNKNGRYFDDLLRGYMIEDILITCNENQNINLCSFNKSEVKIHERFCDELLKLISQIKEKNQDEILLLKIRKLIDDYFGKLVLNINSYCKDDMRHTRFDTLYKCIQDIFLVLKDKYDLKYYDNNIYKLACFIQKSIENYYNLALKDYEKKIAGHFRFLREYYMEEYELAYKVVSFIKSSLDLSIGNLEIIIIMLYLISLNNNSISCKIKAIIVAHGYSTASSIANVSNHLLESNVFESFDMPIETSTKDIINKLEEYFSEVNTSRGVMILVDMGSLEEIYKGLEGILHGTIGIVNNITTKLALKVGNCILKDLEVEEIVKDIKTLDNFKCKVIFPVEKKKRALIVTCMTGIGTAKKIKSLLAKSLGGYAKSIEIIPYGYLKLYKNKHKDIIFNNYDVQAIIGTEDPNILEVPFLYIDDLISSYDTYIFNEVLKNIIPKEKIYRVKQSILKYFTLESVLSYITILNPNLIIDQLEVAIEALQYELKRNFSNDTKICLYIHLSCLIERLITKTHLEEEHIENIDEFKIGNKDFISVIKRSFSVIENYYSVKLPITEIYYLYEILSVKLEKKV
ncbi:sigma 54-interacting transcriptional regulator [Maledivibacter halophilus]|uniref:Transcriptional regulatory protein LevR, contains PRD, AAA+ and EIIA domains n=1 Tax=Maledivibacter halophilus TaxID=36842 RepID=A0A1T5I945_9FIRM|nr:sigma 54-interacting transcriptional regulator [Maledivibacter halophilus]SKC35689.1 Transcriptional regulatory protein LevR, contains PRD, AAA+ and EIIA domains [Maledivibacter halophilus]